MKKLFILAVTMMLLVSTVSFSVSAAGAEEIQPYAIPIIQNTQCTHCGNTMVNVGEYSEYEEVTVASCPNSTAAHKHDYRYIYDTYQCMNCGNYGRAYKKTTMRCFVGMNPYSLNIN